MSQQFVGMCVGGIGAALFYGFSNVLAKAAMQTGIGMGWYMLIIGIAVAILGAASIPFFPGHSPTSTSALLSSLLGFTWGAGMLLVALGLTKYGVPLGKLVPLYNMNTLVAVLLALWVFAEWKQVKGVQLFFGSVLIVLGGVLVSRS